MKNKFFSAFNFLSKRSYKTVFYEYEDTLHKLQKVLPFKIKNPEYYIKALTHRSYLELNPVVYKSNERLEFLGDTVLDLIVSEFLFFRFRNKSEGDLTKLRSQLVDKEALYAASERIHLENVILYNYSYADKFELGMKTILSDAVEALIGAIYLDLGLKKTKKVVSQWILEPNLRDKTYKIDKNYKGQLLELRHSMKLENPVYKLVNEEGPEHNKEFTVEVHIGDSIYGTGLAKNKKNAEQQAAHEALEKLQKTANYSDNEGDNSQIQ